MQRETSEMPNQKSQNINKIKEKDFASPKKCQKEQLQMNKVVYLSKNQFLYRISKYVNPILFLKFEKLFSQEFKDLISCQPKARLSKPTNIIYRFPFVQDHDEIAMKKKLNLFVVQYEEKSVLNNKTTFKAVEVEPEDQKRSLQRLKLGTKKIDKNACQGPRQKSCPKHQQWVEEEELKQNDKFEVPAFLKERQKAFNTLLSSLYSKELQQVKALIKEQIAEKRGLLPYYVQLSKEYLQYTTIRDQDWQSFIEKCPEEVNSEDLVPKQMLDIELIQENPLAKVWGQIYDKLPSMISDKLNVPQAKWNKYLSEECVRVLCEGLRSIRLYESQNKLVQGANFNSSICIGININHRGLLTQSQFKNGPLRPFLFLVITRQLTHYLIRSFEKLSFQQSDPSFCSKTNSTFGANFLKMVSGLQINLPNKQLRLKEKKMGCLNKLVIKNMKEMDSYTEDLKKIYIKFRTQEKIFNDEFKQIKSIIQTFQAAIKFFQLPQLREHTRQLQNSWDQIDKYIDQLTQEMQPKCCFPDQERDEERQKYYKIFFSAFISQNKIGEYLFPFLQKDKQKYQNKLDKLRKYNGEYYFIKESPIIESIVQIIRQSSKIQTVLHQLEKYSIYLLKQKLTIPSLNEKMKIYYQQISEVLKEYNIKDINANWKTSITNYVFEQYSISKYIQQKNQKKLIFFDRKYLQNYLFLNNNLKDNIRDLFELEAEMCFFKEFLNYYDLMKVIYQLPSFCNPINATRKHEAGYYMEKRLYPSLNGFIYAKDYQYMVNFDKAKENQKIGIVPSSYEQAQLKVPMRSNTSDHSYINCSGGWCGTEAFGNYGESNQLLRQILKRKQKQRIKLQEEKIKQLAAIQKSVNKDGK